MRVFTSHMRPDEPPSLVREGFSWAALLFGFLYLAAHRAWIPAALNLAALVGAFWLAGAAGSGAPVLGLAILQGVFAGDLRRWALARRGFTPGPVVAATDRDHALVRLIAGLGGTATP